MNTENEPRQDDQPAKQVETESAEERSSRPIWVIILASLGVIAVIAALGVGIFQLASQTPKNIADIGTNLGNLFQREERLTISAGSMTVASGELVTLSINHRGLSKNESGTYSIELDCPEGVTVKVDDKEVACGQKTEIPSTKDKVEISLATSKERYTDVPIVVRFTGEENKTLESKLTLTVVNRHIASDTPTTGEGKTPVPPKNEGSKTPEKETPKTPKPTTPAKPNQPSTVTPSGIADLRVTAQGIGYIDAQTQRFVRSDSVGRNDQAAARFVIKNIGTKETGNWYFTAILPTRYDKYRRSGKQISLKPGQEMEFVLILEGDIDYRSDMLVYFQADAYNNVTEASKFNNFAEVKLNFNR